MQSLLHELSFTPGISACSPDYYSTLKSLAASYRNSLMEQTTFLDRISHHHQGPCDQHANKTPDSGRDDKYRVTLSL